MDVDVQEADEEPRQDSHPLPELRVSQMETALQQLQLVQEELYNEQGKQGEAFDLHGAIHSRPQ